MDDTSCEEGEGDVWPNSRHLDFLGWIGFMLTAKQKLARGAGQRGGIKSPKRPQEDPKGPKGRALVANQRRLW